MSVLLLELVDRLEVAVEVRSVVVPRVSGIVDVLVSPEVGENDLAAVRSQVGEGVENVPAEA